jgi:hypothetical protein
MPSPSFWSADLLPMIGYSTIFKTGCDQRGCSSSAPILTCMCLRLMHSMIELKRCGIQVQGRSQRRSVILHRSLRVRTRIQSDFRCPNAGALRPPQPRPPTAIPRGVRRRIREHVTTERLQCDFGQSELGLLFGVVINKQCSRGSAYRKRRRSLSHSSGRGRIGPSWR